MADEMEITMTGEDINILDALKEVIKKAAVYDGLRRGIHEYVSKIQ